jgi:hypothetical protein
MFIHFSLRAAMASPKSKLLCLGFAVAALVGALAYTSGPTGRAALIVVIILTGGIVSVLIRTLRGVADDKPGSRAAELAPRDFPGNTFAPAPAGFKTRRPRLNPCPPAGAMLNEKCDSSGLFTPSWEPSERFGEGVAEAAFWLGRLDTDLRSVLQNEVETRGQLAREVYGVPEEWLDEVMRVRMSGSET